MPDFEPLCGICFGGLSRLGVLTSCHYLLCESCMQRSAGKCPLCTSDCPLIQFCDKSFPPVVREALSTSTTDALAKISERLKVQNHIRNLVQKRLCQQIDEIKTQARQQIHDLKRKYSELETKYEELRAEKEGLQRSRTATDIQHLFAISPSSRPPHGLQPTNGQNPDWSFPGGPSPRPSVRGSGGAVQYPPTPTPSFRTVPRPPFTGSSSQPDTNSLSPLSQHHNNQQQRRPATTLFANQSPLMSAQNFSHTTANASAIMTPTRTNQSHGAGMAPTQEMLSRYSHQQQLHYPPRASEGSFIRNIDAMSTSSSGSSRAPVVRPSPAGRFASVGIFP